MENEQFPKLIFPDCGLKVRLLNGKLQVFDVVRKKFVRLLPEEWVRQHLVHFLQIQTKWPLTHIAVELGLKLPTGLQKRCDVLLHGPNGQPVVLAECKAPNIALTQQAVNQVAQYNLHFKLPYLVVTNGLAILIYHINFETKQIESQAALPNFDSFLA